MTKKEFLKPGKEEGIEVSKVELDLGAIGEATNASNSKYATFADAEAHQKGHAFKNIIISESSNDYLNVMPKDNSTKEFPINILNFLSLKFSLGEVKKKIVAALVAEEDATNTEKVSIAQNIISEIRFTNDKDRNLIAILNKNIILKNNEIKTAIDSCKNDPFFKYNVDKVPPLLRELSIDYKEMTVVGSEIVLVLNIRKIISTIILPRMIVKGGAKATYNQFIKLSEKIETSQRQIFFALKVESASTCTDLILVERDNFVVANLTMTTAQFVNKASIAVNKLNMGSAVQFFRTADIKSNNNVNDPVINNMLGIASGIPVLSAPLIRLNTQNYLKSSISTKNPLLDSLIGNSSSAPVLSTDKVSQDFSTVIDKIFTYYHNDDIYILPNFRKLALIALFKEIGVNPFKIDVTTDMDNVSIALSI